MTQDQGVARGEGDEQPTLRDQFAMAALQGLIASPRETPPPTVSTQTWVTAAAEVSYQYADAMMKARGSTDER